MLLMFPSNSFFLNNVIVDNELTGSIPTEVGSLTTLDYLNFGKQLFSVLLLYFETRQICFFMFLTILLLLFHIADNELKGSIPNELGSLIYLQGLDFGMYILSN